MMKIHQVCALLAVFFYLNLFAAPAGEPALVWRGVLGNSGEAGETLVRGAHDASGRGNGIGVVYDPAGTLWAAGGPGVLNRYALDGRQLASYKISGESSHLNRMTLCGQTLVLLLGKQLYTLPLDAAPGSAAIALKLRASHLSFGTREGQVACFDQEKGELFLLNPLTKQTSLVTQYATKENISNLEMTPQGRIILGNQEVINGALKPVAGMPKHPGEALQYLDGFWFGHAWHGTIFRYAEDFAPTPGVIYGGASGSVIAHLDSDEEFSKGSGVACITPTLYASAGMNATITLFAWDVATRKMSAVRRIGPFINDGDAIACNGKQIWVRTGSWDWDDNPATPLRRGVVYGGDGQLAVRADATVSGPVRQYGSQAVWLYGALDKEASGINEQYAKSGLRTRNTGVAVQEESKLRRAILINKKGETAAVRLGGDGKPAGSLPAPKLEVSAPVKVWNTLGLYEGKLLAAGDGSVIEFAAEGDNWRETRRWNSWGANDTEKFGSEISFCVDGRDLWVSDTRKHRVLVFDLAGKNAPLTLGSAAGTEAGQFNLPQAISAHHGRAAVIDAGNFRIVKLEKTGDMAASR